MGKFIVVHSIKVATDFTPETFGRLTTIGPKFRLPKGKGHDTYQVCQCSCDGKYIVTGSWGIKSGHTKSCGCLNIQLFKERATNHGMSHTPEYYAWAHIVQRCENAKSQEYHNYGGRGVSVHPDWRDPSCGFQRFFDYIGPRLTPEHSIDRYPDKDGNYEPGNVRWATQKEQQRNRRNNVNLTHNGKTQCLTAWAEEMGISAATLWSRLKSGWSVEKAITHPVKVRRCL